MDTHRLPPAASLLLALLLLVTLPAAAFADGKIFTRYATPAPTPIPDQQAIIVYDAAKQIQTLAIETRFIPPSPPPSSPAGAEKSPTDAAPFAWVVPLPGPDAPTIRAATTGLFPTVREVFRPRVIDREPDTSTPMVVFTILVLAGVWLTTIQKRGILWGLGIAVLIFVGFSCLLPTLGKARSSAGGSESLVTVLNRTIVGSYDVAVIGSAAPNAGADPLAAGKQLTAWLKDNGFHMPSGVEPVLSHYAARQWVFAACKLREPLGASGPLAPHPLIFTFKTAQCVYPLELTGVGNGPLSVDLFVFSNQRAAASGFEEIRCAILGPGAFVAEERPNPFRDGGDVKVVHPLLKDLAAAATVATKLSGTLTPQQQTADAYLTWKPGREYGGTKFSRAGASGRALDCASIALLVSVIGLIIIAAAKKQAGGWVFRKIAWPLLIAMAIGGGVYASLPQVEVEPTRRGRRWLDLMYEHAGVAGLAFDLIDALPERRDPTKPPTIEQARAAVAHAWTTSGSTEYSTPREEDSPGNYTIELDSDRGVIEYMWYDAEGAAHREALWPESSEERDKLRSRKRW